MHMTPNEAQTSLSNLAKATTTPSILRFGVAKASDIDSAEYDVRSNHLWSARWAGTTVLLLTLRETSNPRTVIAAPVTIEPGLEDKESVVLDPSSNELGLPMTVWLGIKKEVPVRTLNRPLGEITADIFAAGEVIEAHGVPQHSAGVRLGQERYGNRSPSAEKRAELDDLLDQWIQELEPLAPQPEKTVGKQQKPSFTLQQVMEALNVPQRQAMNIVRGRQQLTAAEAQQLAAYVGSTADIINEMAEPVPLSLLLELEQPRWRYLVRTEAQSEKTDESQARLGIAHQAFALAARQSGQDEDAWRQRLRTIALGHIRSNTNKGG